MHTLYKSQFVNDFFYEFGINKFFYNRLTKIVGTKSPIIFTADFLKIGGKGGGVLSIKGSLNFILKVIETKICLKKIHVG